MPTLFERQNVLNVEKETATQMLELYYEVNDAVASNFLGKKLERIKDVSYISQCLKVPKIYVERLLKNLQRIYLLNSSVTIQSSFEEIMRTHFFLSERLIS